MRSLALNRAPVADHATDAGMQSVLNARAAFRAGPLVGVANVASSLVWVRKEQPDQGRCECGRADCAVDRLSADWTALDTVQSDSAAVDVQVWLAHRAYLIARRACVMGEA